jgi:hypothetical protein
MKKYLILFLIIFSKVYFAQSETSLIQTALPTLGYQISPLLTGAGSIGAAIPMEDAVGFYYNPAQLGYFSRKNSISGFFMPQSTDLYPGRNYYSNDNVTSKTSSVTLGYNYESANTPISFGFGYITNKVSYGIFDYPNPGSNSSSSKYESYDSYDCYSLGFGYHNYFLFNFGFSVKSYRSALGGDFADNQTVVKIVDGTAFDFGALIIAPLSQLYMKNARYYIMNGAIIKPKMNFSLGYAISNIGKKVSYIDASQADPLPRTARLGYSLDLGIDLQLQDTRLNAVDYSFTAEVSDLLIKHTDSFNIDYQNLLGDIKFGDNLIKLKADDNVVVHKGHIFRLFETLIITSGRYNGNGADNIKSGGFGISSQGIFKLINSFVDNSTINYIADHLVLEYYNTSNRLDLPNEQNYKGFAIYIKSMTF